jgi:hypothetical protein
MNASAQLFKVTNCYRVSVPELRTSGVNPCLHSTVLGFRGRCHLNGSLSCIYISGLLNCEHVDRGRIVRTVAYRIYKSVHFHSIFPPNSRSCLLADTRTDSKFPTVPWPWGPITPLLPRCSPLSRTSVFDLASRSPPLSSRTKRSRTKNRLKMGAGKRKAWLIARHWSPVSAIHVVLDSWNVCLSGVPVLPCWRRRDYLRAACELVEERVL